MYKHVILKMSSGFFWWHLDYPVLRPSIFLMVDHFSFLQPTDVLHHFCTVTNVQYSDMLNYPPVKDNIRYALRCVWSAHIQTTEVQLR